MTDIALLAVLCISGRNRCCKLFHRLAVKLRLGLHWTGSVSRCSRPAPSMRCLSYVHLVGRGLPVLRAPGRTVDLKDHPAGGGPRLYQLERQVLAGVGEQPPALADDHGVGEQGDLVDEVVLE